MRSQISSAELEAIVRDYNSVFPDWRLLSANSFYREVGPVLQQIGFERLRTGAYRPSTRVRILSAPDSSAFPQFLSVKLRSTYPEAHASMRDRVINAMITEFVPRVMDPLEPLQVLRLYENQEMLKSADAYALAGLNAYLGRWERALYWCAEFSMYVEKLGMGWQPFDVERRAFLSVLNARIASGTAMEWLEAVVDSERRRLGVE